MTQLEEVITDLVQPVGGRIALVVLDGLGGFAGRQQESELSAALTPNLDQLANEGALGLHDPVCRGITPGSGAGHLGLFGYDPLRYRIGRGVLTAAAVGVDLQPGDIAARVNVCTLASDGRVTDRRAGRLTTAETAEICDTLMSHLELPDAEFFLYPEQEYRALLVLRGADLSSELQDTDPHRDGVPPSEPLAKSRSAERTAGLVKVLLDGVRDILAGHRRGNFLLLRGFDAKRPIPAFPERYRMRALGAAEYPTYLGLAKVLGFETHKVEAWSSSTVSDLDLRAKVEQHDFLYLHIKGTDSAGEDGDFERKVGVIEEVDALIPAILDTGIDVLAVTGDHSTPSQMSAHSWHPVPVAAWGGSLPAERKPGFDEQRCRQGSLGRFDAHLLMPQLLAAAGRLVKYCA